MDLRKVKSKKGFTLIELMVVIVIIGILVAIALPNFISAQDRAKVSSVKANMHTVQTAVETYGVDWGGVYEAALQASASQGIQVEANNKGYWKEFKNPFNGQQGVDKSWQGAAASGFTETNCVTGSFTASRDGQVLYAGFTGGGSSTSITKYYIYGGAKESGKCIEDKGKGFFLTNQ